MQTQPTPPRPGVPALVDSHRFAHDRVLMCPACARLQAVPLSAQHSTSSARAGSWYRCRDAERSTVKRSLTSKCPRRNRPVDGVLFDLARDWTRTTGERCRSIPTDPSSNSARLDPSLLVPAGSPQVAPRLAPRASPANHSDQRPGRRQAQSLTLKRQQTSATTLDWNRNIQIETTEAKSNGIHTYNLGDNLKLIRRNRQLTLPHSQRDLQSDQFP